MKLSTLMIKRFLDGVEWLVNAWLIGGNWQHALHEVVVTSEVVVSYVILFKKFQLILILFLFLDYFIRQLRNFISYWNGRDFTPFPDYVTGNGIIPTPFHTATLIEKSTVEKKGEG